MINEIRLIISWQKWVAMSLLHQGFPRKVNITLLFRAFPDQTPGHVADSIKVIYSYGNVVDSKQCWIAH